MKTPEEIFEEAIQAKGLDIVSVRDADLYEAGLDAIKQALSIANVGDIREVCWTCGGADFAHYGFCPKCDTDAYSY